MAHCAANSLFGSSGGPVGAAEIATRYRELIRVYVMITDLLVRGNF
jgi:hypothetical protein